MDKPGGVGPLMPQTLLLRTGDREFRVEVQDGRVVVDGTAVEVPRHAIAAADGSTRWVFLNGEVYEFEVQNPSRPSSQMLRRGRRGAAHHGSLTAPMPATVRKINVEPGKSVRKGETLLVLEAMKMELPLKAPADGVVTSIECRVGELVQPGVPLVVVE